MLSLNSLVNLSANIPSVVAIKCIILDNLLQTTRIISFPATNSNFVIKFTVKCVHSFSKTLLSFSFFTSTSIYSLSSDTYHIFLLIFPYLSLLLATSNFLSSTLLSFTSLYVLLPVYHGVTRLSPLLMLYLSVHTLFLSSV